jgi:hypothetical protein
VPRFLRHGNVFVRAARTACFAVALTLTGGFANAQGLPPGKMRDTVQAACSTCHPVTRFTALRKSRAGWTRTMNSMIDKGAVIGDSEFEPLVDYLTEHFAPEKILDK